MFHARPAPVLVALILCSIGVSAQTPPSSGSSPSLTFSQLNVESAQVPPPSTSNSVPEAPVVNPDAAPKTKPKKLDKLRVHPFSTFAIGVKVDTLGGGIELATPLARTLNLRATANLVNFGYDFSIDGIAYTTKIDFHSGQANIDWFPFHGSFHVSPGILYFHNTLSGTVAVPAGQPFELSSTNYINSVDDPVSGTVAITYARSIAPIITLGFGNIIPRSGKHITLPFEIGAAYTGPALMTIHLAGTACTNTGCFNAATDPGTQASLLQEEQTLNGDIAKVKFYPLISTGIAFRF